MGIPSARASGREVCRQRSAHRREPLSAERQGRLTVRRREDGGRALVLGEGHEVLAELLGLGLETPIGNHRRAGGR